MHNQDLYDQARNATNKDANAYIILNKDSRPVAKITVKFSNQRCTAFLWVKGAGIYKGIAHGGGYDRESASIRKAAQKLVLLPEYTRIVGYADQIAEIKTILDKDDGHTWHERFFQAGYSSVSIL